MTTGTLTCNYNNGKEFCECLEGILGQTKKPDRIVVVDDGSTDNSIELIKDALRTQLGKDHKFMVLDRFGTEEFKVDNTVISLHKLPTNVGPSAARNVGLRSLIDKVDVVFIADADDIYYPTKIERSLAIFEKYPNVAVVYSDYDTENIELKRTVREFKESYDFKRLFEECIVSNNSAIRLEVLKDVGGYDETIRGGEDYDLWLRIGEKYPVYHIAEALYKYRLTGKNATVVTPKEKFAQDIRKVHEKAHARRQRRMNHA